MIEINKCKYCLSIFLSIIIVLTMPLFAYSVDNKMTPDEWETHWYEQQNNISAICITPGKDESEMNFAWLSHLFDVNPVFKIATKPDMSDARLFIVEISKTNLLLWSNKVCVSGLEPDTTYYYSYSVCGVWQSTQSFKTARSNALKVLFVSDSQIGRSGDSLNKSVQIADSYGWYSTLHNALSIHNADMILSGGDQVELAISNRQYNSFLAAPMLKNIPIANAIGNHDFYFPLFKHHFNNPNEYKREFLASPAGCGYWFPSNDTLFIVLNSNNPLSFDNESIINEAVNSCNDLKWRVVMMHHSIYSNNSGEDENLLRSAYAPLFDKYDIDLVLSGHDHYYSRSHSLTGNKIDDDGVVYITVGSASGSKINFPNEDSPFFVKSAPRLDAPNYIVLDFSGDFCDIKSYRADTNTVIDEFTLIKDVQSDELFEAEKMLIRIINIFLIVIKSIF